jgi:DNA-binding cell septation regulator SpoVG
MDATKNTIPEAPVITVSGVRIRMSDHPLGSLLGWASCVVDGNFFFNNIEIRRAADGRVFLAFPRQTCGKNMRHFIFNPITREAGRALEEAILSRLFAGGESHGNRS